MKKITTFITPLLLFISFSAALAEVKTFVKEYTYQASEFDSKASSRTLALEQVKRHLLEELGIYLESETDVKNYQLTKDQITTLTAGVVSAEIITENWDGKTYYLKSKISADPEEVAKSIDNLRKDRQKMKELEESRKRVDELLYKIKMLEKRTIIAGKDKGKGTKKWQKNYSAMIKEINAEAWNIKGHSFLSSGKYSEAIEAFSKAIELDPNAEDVYLNRGSAYLDIGNYQKAIIDNNSIIKLGTKYVAEAYNNRGLAYYLLGQHDRATKDYTMAIELLDPKAAATAAAYFNRGNIYSLHGDYRKATEDYDKAIELNQTDSSYHHHRGNAHHNLGNFQQAVVAYNKSIELNPEKPKVYSNRGDAYAMIGNWQQALNDLDNAIGLGEKSEDTYQKRGIAYSMLGNQQKAISDYLKVVEINPKYYRAYVRIGSSYFLLGNVQQAIKYYDRAIQKMQRFTISEGLLMTILAIIGRRLKILESPPD